MELQTNSESHPLNLADIIRHSHIIQTVSEGLLKLPRQFAQNNRILKVWLIVIIHITLSFAFLALFLHFELELVIEGLGGLLISLITSFCIAYSTFLRGLFIDHRKYILPIIAPCLIMMVGIPLASFLWLFCVLYILQGLYANYLMNQLEGIVIALSCFQIWTIILKIQNYIQTDWRIILIFPVVLTAILFGAIVVQLFCTLRQIQSNSSGRCLRAKITELVFTELNGLSIVSFLYAPIHWAYIAPNIHTLANVFFIYNLLLLALVVSFYKELVYVNCSNFGFTIAYRHTQHTFTQNYTDLKLRWQEVNCIKCQCRPASIISARCYHLSMCEQCFKKSNQKECSICKRATKSMKIQFQSHLENSYFKIAFYRSFQYKLFARYE